MPRITLSRALTTWALCALLGASAHAEKNLKRPPGTTRYAPMLAQLKSLLAYDKTQGESRMQLTSIGRSVKGRDIWMVTLHEPPSAPVAADDENAQTGADAAPAMAAPPKKLLYLCRQHGHEPASTEGALAFIRDLVKAAPDAPLTDDLRRVTVSVVPMANPDGAEAFLRHNAHDVDLNRDWLRRTQPETQAWYHTVMRFQPDLMTDQHELYPDDTRPDFTETAGIGSGASETVIETCADTQAVVAASMAAAGFPTVSHTITDRHPARLAHRYGCVVMGVPTILFETNRLNGSGRGVAARGQAHYQFMMTVLRDLAGERQQLLAEATAARAGLRPDSQLASRHKPYQRPGASLTPPPASAPTVTPPPAPGTAGQDVPVDKDSD